MVDHVAREAFLARVAAELELPLELERDVLEELRGHIEDTTSGLRDEGLDAERAEREALARLGAPSVLAERLRSAHQTRRRALAAAAGGVWTATSEGFYALVFGSLFLTVTWWLAALGLLTVAWITGWTTSRASDLLSTTTFAAIVWAFAAERAARAATLIVAARSRRRVRAVAIPVAIAGTTFLAWQAAAVATLSLDWPAVACTAAIPVAFAIGALRAREGDGWRWRPWRTWRALVAVTVVLALGGVAVGLMSPAPIRQWEIDPTTRDAVLRFDRIGPAAPIDDPSWINGPESSWSTGSPVFASWTIDPAVPAPWRDLRVEIWRADSPDGPIAADAVRPALVEPVQVVDDVIQLTIEPPRFRDLTAWWFVLTGLDADGQRVRINDPTAVSTTFRGTLIDWFSSGDSPDR